MSQSTNTQTGAASGVPPTVGLYKDPKEASAAVSSSYDYWSGNLTTSSLQMNYALIGANWIIFGSVNGILGSFCAKWSMLLVLLALVVNVVGSWILSEVLRKRIFYAEENYPRWGKEFEVARGKKDPWPFTNAIDNIGRWMRWIKATLIIASGIFLIVGAILK
jgi:hypothetical protein